MGSASSFLFRDLLNLVTKYGSLWELDPVWPFFFVITGFIAFFRAFHLKQKLFSIVFVSSIFIRLFLMTLSLILLIKFSQVHKPVLLISLFGWYFIFQIWELISFNRLAVKEV